MGLSSRGASYGRVLSSESIPSVTTSTAVALTVPAGTKSVLVTVGSNPVRFRSDGTDPSTTVGHYIAANGNLEVFGDEAGAIRFISATSTTSIFATYYGE